MACTISFFSASLPKHIDNSWWAMLVRCGRNREVKRVRKKSYTSSTMIDNQHTNTWRRRHRLKTKTQRSISHTSSTSMHAHCLRSSVLWLSRYTFFRFSFSFDSVYSDLCKAMCMKSTTTARCVVHFVVLSWMCGFDAYVLIAESMQNIRSLCLVLSSCRFVLGSSYIHWLAGCMCVYKPVLLSNVYYNQSKIKRFAQLKLRLDGGWSMLLPFELKVFINTVQF